jgi:2,3-bisphosphoglycerate-independent phosphoglycerate mutase
MPANYLKPLLRQAQTKIVLLVFDGLGGLPLEPGGLTELETAQTPNLDRLAAEGELGQSIPIRPGITPGSGPAHLALFGYDPLEYVIGRGVLSATGIGIHVSPGDIAARGNFCTVDTNGVVVDRRAGRIPSEEAAPLIALLQQISIPDVEVEVRLEKEYRFTIVMRGSALSPALEDTDPQQVGFHPLRAKAVVPEAQRTADLFNHWIDEAYRVLKGQPKANGVLLRGFASDPDLPKFLDCYGLKAACIAVYPMYRGVSRLVGMDVINFDGETPADQFKAAAGSWEQYDFFFIHIKKTDSKGEDGDFAGKAGIIEDADRSLPALIELRPDVWIITGDHSTPAKIRTHTWHPVPYLLWAPASVRPDRQSSFGEQSCIHGGLGTIRATETMPLALAHAGRLDKFGA